MKLFIAPASDDIPTLFVFTLKNASTGAVLSTRTGLTEESLVEKVGLSVDSASVNGFKVKSAQWAPCFTATKGSKVLIGNWEREPGPCVWCKGAGFVARYSHLANKGYCFACKSTGVTLSP